MKTKTKLPETNQIKVLGWILILVSILYNVLYISINYNNSRPYDLFGDISTNWIPGLFSIGFTILVIDTLYEKQRERQQKQSLILQMGSPDNGFAIEAVRQLRVKGWLFDGSLRNADLRDANLDKADLSYADLQGAKLAGVNLKSAVLDNCNLAKAYLVVSDFRNAQITTVNFKGANLSNSKFQGATIFDVEFSETDLTFCNFKGVFGFVNQLDFLSPDPIRVAKALRGAILPNGKIYMGNYKLPGDIAEAKALNIETNNKSAMQRFYRKGPISLHADEIEIRKSWADEHTTKT